MNVLDGCHSARNQIKIEEIKCPVCGNLVEIFIRDQNQIGDSICENCGYVFREDEYLFWENY